MDIQVKKLPKSQVQISVKLTKEEREKWEKKALEKLAKSTKLDGFRAGKVPPKVVEEKIGKEGLRVEALDMALPEIYYEAVSENKLQPITQPKLETKDPEEWELELTVDVLPEVKVGDWKKIKVKKNKIEVRKEELDEMIERLRAQMAEYKEVKRAAKEGDRLEIDFEGFIDGKAFEGGKSKNHPIVIGKSQFVPGFEEQLVGLKVDGEKEIKITFPEDYHKEDLQDKEATFKVKVHKVEEINLPETNEEFVAKITGGKLKNLEELKKDTEEHLKKQKEHEEKQRLDNEVLSKIAELTTMEIPASMIKEEVSYMKQDFEQHLAQYGLSLEKYLVGQKKKLEDLEKDWEKEADKRVKMRMGMQQIAEDEKLEPLPAEVEERAQKLKPDAKGEELERIKGRVHYAIRAEKALDRILETVLK